MGNHRPGRAPWLLVGAFVLGIMASVAFLRPTLLAPVSGDDRILFPTMASLSSWTPVEELTSLPTWWQERSDIGRVNVLSLLERRSVARMVVDTSVDTGTPPYLLVALLKLLLAAACVLTLTALVRSLRCRAPDGVLVRVSRPTVLLCTLGGAVLFAVGSQPQLLDVNGSNAWVSYPTNTYGAVVAVFGSVALVLWLARLYAERRHRVLVIATLVVLAVVTNFRYELGFPAVPLAVLALLLVPVTSADRVAEGRRAKWVAGLAYAGAFLPIFVAIRAYLWHVCATSTCHADVSPRVGTQALSTFGLNVVSSVPGVGSGQATDFVARTGGPTQDMFVPTAWSVIVAAALGAALVLGRWWVRTTQRAAPDGSPGVSDGVAGPREEARMLAIGALLLLLGAVAAAAVISVSQATQDGMRLGLLSRHTVLTWAGLAWALLLGVVALGRLHPRAGVAAWLALAVAVTALAAVQLPAGQRSLMADREVNAASASAFEALMEGGANSTANASRCQLVAGLLDEPNWPGGGAKSVRVFAEAFQARYALDFCRPGPGTADVGPAYERALRGERFVRH